MKSNGIIIAFAVVLSLLFVSYSHATPTISPSNPTIDNGQSIAFSSTWTDGVPIYTAQLYSSSTSTCNSGSTLVQTLPNLASASATFGAVAPTSATYYCAFVTGNAIGISPTASITNSIFSGGVNDAVIAPSGSYAYAPLFSGRVAIIDTSTNTVVGTVSNGGFNNPMAVAFSKDGSFAYVTNYASSNVVIIDTATNTVTGYINSGFNLPAGVAISPSGSFAYISNSNSANVVIVSTATNTVVGAIDTGTSTAPRGVAFSPDGSFAYVFNGWASAQSVLVISTTTNNLVGTITSGTFNINSWGIAFSPTGRYALVVNGGAVGATSNTLSILSAETNSVIGTYSGGLGFPSGIGFSPDGSYAYVGNIGNVLIINTNPGTVNSINSEITVNPKLTAGITYPCKPSNCVANNANVFDVGQSVLIGATFSGGTSTFTCNQMIWSLPSNTQVANANYTFALGCGNTFGPLSQTGNFYSNTIITDSAYSPETVNTVNSITYTVNPALATPTISTPSATKIDYTGSALGSQTTNYNAFISGGGTTPYSYTFDEAGATNHVLVQAYTVGATNSVTDTQLQTFAAGNYIANVVVSDSASTPAYVTSLYTANIMVAAQPTYSTFAPNAGAFDAGQTITYTFTVANGFGPFTIELYNITGSKQVGSNVIIASPGGSNSISFVADATGAFSYQARTTDIGASNPFTFFSSTNAINVNAGLTAENITPSVPIIGKGMSVTLASNVSGGTSPYTYQWYSGSSSSCASDTTALGTASTQTVSPSSDTYYCYSVTDSATPSATAKSNTALVTVTNDITYNGILNSTAPGNSVIAAPGYGQYFCAEGNWAPYNQTLNWTNDASFGLNDSAVGHKSGNICSSSNATDGGLETAMAIVGVSKNLSSYSIITTNVFDQPSNTFLETYTLNKAAIFPHSFVLLMLGCGFYACNSITLPQQCTPLVNASGNSGVGSEAGTAYAAICSQQAGTYSINVITQNLGAQTSFVAYYLTSGTASLSASSPSVLVGLSDTLTARISNATGPVTVKFVASNGTVMSTQSTGGTGTVSFAFTPQSPGTYTFNVIAVDNGVSPPSVFNSSRVTFTASYPGGGGGSGPGPSTTTTGTSTTTTSTTSTGTTSASTTVIVIPPSNSATSQNFTITSNSPTGYGFINGNAIIGLFTSSNSPQTGNVFIGNATGTAPSGPSGYTLLSAIVVNVTPASVNAGVTVTMHYNCNIPSSLVAPYKFAKPANEWVAITPFSINTTACTITFTVPKDPIVALFETPAPVTSVTTSASTTAATTAATTSIATVVTQPYPSSGTTIVIAIIVLIIILIVVALAYSRLRKR